MPMNDKEIKEFIKQLQEKADIFQMAWDKDSDDWFAAGLAAGYDNIALFLEEYLEENKEFKSWVRN